VDFAEHADLTGRIRGLVILLEDRLTVDQSRRVDELVDASEFATALETLAGWLGEDATPIPDDVRLDFERLADRTGSADAVTAAIARCPREDGEAGR
jgi:hypothetical protein